MFLKKTEKQWYEIKYWLWTGTLLYKSRFSQGVVLAPGLRREQAFLSRHEQQTISSGITLARQRAA